MASDGERVANMHDGLHLFSSAAVPALPACAGRSDNIPLQSPGVVTASHPQPVERQEDSPIKGRESDELLVRVQRRDAEALAELFDKYCRLVFSIGYRVLRSATEAEDLVQDVFLFLWSRSNLFAPGKRSAHDWIIRVIYHRAFDRRRYLITRLSYNYGGEDSAARGTNQESGEDRASRVVSHEGNIGELLYWHSYLESAFDELSEAQRKTLTLFFYEGYTLAEISSVLGESLMNVRNHYYRGLKHLGKYMNGHDK